MPNNTIDSLEIEVKEVGDASQGLKSLFSSLTKLKNAVDKINKMDEGGIGKLHTLSESIRTLSEAGNGAGLSKVISTIRKLSKLDFSSISTGADAINKVAGAIGNVSTPASSSFPDVAMSDVKEQFPAGDDDTAKNTKKISVNWAEIKEHIKESGKGATQFFASIKRIAMYRAIRSLLNMITTGIREGINNVYQWSKSFGGTFSQSMDSIASSFNYLKNSLGALTVPIFNALAPAIEFITNKFVDLLNVINQVISRLSGATTWTRAIKTQTEYAKATEKSAKEVRNLLNGFDEINNIGGSVNDAGPSTGKNGSYAFVEEPIDTEKIDAIIEKLKDIAWYVGAVTAGIAAWKFGKALAELLGIKDALSFATGLGLITVGVILEFKGIHGILTEGINGKNFTETILGGLGLAGGGALLGKSIGGALGGAIGIGVGGLVASLPATFAGIWSSVNEGISWLSALLTEAGTTGLGASIGAIVGALGGPIGAGVGALIGIAVGAVTNGVIAIIQHAEDIKTWWNDTALPWLQNVGYSIKTWFDERIEHLKTMWANIKTTCVEKVGEVKTFVVEKVGELKTSFLNKLTELKTGAVNKFNEIKNSATQLFKDIKDGLSQFFIDIGNKISEKVRSILNNYVISPLNRLISWINEKLHFSYSGLRILGKSVIPAFSTTIAHLNTIPSLDVGTNYVPQDQLAFIHKGEAVLPKEFNSKEFFGGANEETNEILERILSALLEKDLSVSISTDEIGEASVRYLKKQQRRMGVSLV